MSKDNFMIKLAKFFLFTEKGGKEWKTDKRLMRAWHILFFAILVVFIIFMVFPILNVQNSTTKTSAVRLLQSFCLGALIIATLYLTFCYCLFVFKRNFKAIFAINLLFLYFITIYLFAQLYQYLYNFNYGLFYYERAPYVPLEKQSYVGLKGYKASLDFLIYSVANSTLWDYWKLRSNSYLISLINAIQRLYGLFFINFIITSFLPREQKKP